MLLKAFNLLTVDHSLEAPRPNLELEMSRGGTKLKVDPYSKNALAFCLP